MCTYDMHMNNIFRWKPFVNKKKFDPIPLNHKRTISKLALDRFLDHAVALSKLFFFTGCVDLKFIRIYCISFDNIKMFLYQ